MADPAGEKGSLQLLAAPAIEKRILVVRGRQVMLDEDLAALYGVETKRLVEQVKRNLERFPGDFMFQLHKDEAAALRSQIAASTLVAVAAAMPRTYSPSKAWPCSPRFCGARRQHRDHAGVCRAAAQRPERPPRVEVIADKSIRLIWHPSTIGLPFFGQPGTLKEMKMLVVDITAADASGGRLGRYKVVERHEDGSLLLAPEAVDEVIAETTERPLNGDEFLDALERLDAAASQHPSR